MKRLCVVKLGGSLITDKSRPLTARKKAISDSVKEVKEAQGLYRGKLLIGHGSGSFGHFLASKYRTQEGVKDKKDLFGASLVSDVAIDLNRLVVKSFLKQGVAVIPFSPGSFLLSRSKKVQKTFAEPILEALSLGFTPLVHGDVVLDTGQGVNISSTETVLGALIPILAKKYRVEKLIYAGVTDGVYDFQGKVIPKITQGNFSKVKKWIGGSSDSDVTGGMIHKVEESLSLAKKHHLKVLIVNGKKPGSIKKAILGKPVVSTTISP